jgi:N-terminal TM domain of oligopeptide transport permease C
MRAALFATRRGRVSIAILGLFVFVAVFGALIAPDDPRASSTAVL